MKIPNLNGVKQVVYDVETNGLDWKKHHVVGHVLCWGPGPDEVAYFPVRHGGGANLDEDKVEEWLQSLFKRIDLRVVGHSLKFDMHMARNHDITFHGPVECTQVNAALIDENQLHYNLDAVAGQYPAVPAKFHDIYAHLATKFGGPIERSQIGNFWKLAGDDPQAVAYATGDGTTTWLLREAQHKDLDEQSLTRVWEVECRVLRTLFRMERRGVAIDVPALKRLKKEMEARLDEAQNQLPKDFNVRSPSQIADYCHSRGLTEWPSTDKGNPSFTESWLGSTPIGLPIVTVRKISNLLNSFINPLLTEHIHDGRVHTNFNQLRHDDFGVITGRLSSNNPNMQQVPKRDKELAPLFRRVFVPTKKFMWSANDYSQQEFRVFADYTGAKLLIDGYTADPPVDIHTAVANLLGVERDPTAKRINLGKLYGMGVVKFARSLGMTEERAKSLFNALDRQLPEARTFLKQAEALARQRGWVRTKLYRRRRFPNPTFAHKAGNSVIQGTSADITKLKMVEIDEYFHRPGIESRLLLQVHDELNWEVAPGEEEVDREARRIMSSFGPDDLIQMAVPMVVDHHTGKSWGAASFPSYVYAK